MVHLLLWVSDCLRVIFSGYFYCCTKYRKNRQKIRTNNNEKKKHKENANFKLNKDEWKIPAHWNHHGDGLSNRYFYANCEKLFFFFSRHPWLLFKFSIKHRRCFELKLIYGGRIVKYFIFFFSSNFEEKKRKKNHFLRVSHLQG